MWASTHSFTPRPIWIGTCWQGAIPQPVHKLWTRNLYNSPKSKSSFPFVKSAPHAHHFCGKDRITELSAFDQNCAQLAFASNSYLFTTASRVIFIRPHTRKLRHNIVIKCKKSHPKMLWNVPVWIKNRTKPNTLLYWVSIWKQIATMSCAFFWVIPRRLNFICRRFGTLSHLHRQVGTYLPAYEDGTVCSETSAYKIQPSVNYPEESIRHSESGKSLKSRL